MSNEGERLAGIEQKIDNIIHTLDGFVLEGTPRCARHDEKLKSLVTRVGVHEKVFLTLGIIGVGIKKFFS